MNTLLLLLVTTTILQVCSVSLQDSLVAPYANLLQENIASNQLQQQINASTTSVLSSLSTYDSYVRNLIDQLLAEYHASIRQKSAGFKSGVSGVQSRSVSLNTGKNLIVKCIVDGNKLDMLAEMVNEQVKRCATVAMAEMSNVISDSLKEAQTFMSIPRVIGRDVQRCGLSNSCRWDIVGDAISEALQVPPKVFALTAKIQSIALRTVVSVDSCGLQGLRQITETAVGVLENIFLCISNSTNYYNSLTNANGKCNP
ncbi:hypothetical protein NQ315_003153 [Exocentrus adspersus]|uniref:Uncharacterized protein n=1 Tax=Exocentrus adspersus TaxID=1586481 RepID=A0AAV8W4D9_9CUCU|nr:hypothetical protein NQ315_003153 [Exocentrus adspersus]